MSVMLEPSNDISMYQCGVNYLRCCEVGSRESVTTGISHATIEADVGLSSFSSPLDSSFTTKSDDDLV